MINKYRVWDMNNKVMIYPEDEVKGVKGEWPTLLTIGLHGLPIVIDRDSFGSNEVVGWNVDHNRVLMRYTGLKNKKGRDVIAGDICLLYGKVFIVVDYGYEFKFSRNMVQFGDNDEYHFGEDTAHTSRYLGNIYEQPNILIGRVN